MRFLLIPLTCLFLSLACLDEVRADSANGRRLAETFDSLQASGVAQSPVTEQAEEELKLATFGSGCFWCTEAVFEELRGVRRVASGYSGGRTANPTYKQVLTGLTGHAEVIHLEYDPGVISYAKLLEVFWRTHDPTTLNRQGPDVGTQYRSVIFYHDDEQRQLALKFKKALSEAHAFRKPIVTEIKKFNRFYLAERDHQDYFARNGRAPYCRQVIRPKLSKFRRVFAEELKRNERRTASKKD